TIEVVKNVEKNIVLRLAAFFHDIGKPQSFFMDNDGVGHFYGHDKLSVEITRYILIRMKYSNNIINEVLSLIDTHMIVYRDEFKNSAVKKLMRKVNVDNLIKFQIADIKATANPNKYEHVLKLKKRCEEIIINKEPINVKQLEINGYDLIEMGLKPGKLIGKILNELLEIVMENPKLNEKEKLMKEVRRKWLI
ncbi:HD domain-containing protein, partial [Clostridiaceae bacterium HSG29]|nr:HD domain-containing protein [Clostridiaceae bacterium HSG29]